MTNIILIGAALCIADVKYHMDAAGGLGFVVNNKEKLKLWLFLLLALLCTMTTIMLGGLNLVYILQVKFALWICLPTYVKASIVGIYSVVLFIRGSFHYRLANVTIHEV